ncbi:hypothetical protein X759_32370 [Mesorhizobium sp. LSHC420B00]|nr:hypothetical protein X759_32370 [Mesorhizobium sp. LSHC420B00]
MYIARMSTAADNNFLLPPPAPAYLPARVIGDPKKAA